MEVKQTRQYIYQINQLPQTPLVLEEEIYSRLLLGEKLLISFIEVPKGKVFPIHDHDSEQILIMLEGSEEHVVDGVTYHMKAGDVCIHPAGVPHGGLGTETGYKGIDIFSPPRESHVELMKQYHTMPDKFGKYPKEGSQI